MRILFVGTHVPNELEKNEKYMSAAGNRFQNNLIKHLRLAGNEVTEISYLGMPLDNPGNYEDHSRYVTKNGKLAASIKEFSHLIKENLKNADIVMCYNVTYAWLNLPRLARKAGVKSLLILADYSGPESYDNPGRKLYAYLMKRSFAGFDRIVGLSENTRDYLKSGQEFVLMEGGIDREFYDAFSEMPPKETQGTINVMYSGVLEKVAGVDVWLKAIEKAGEVSNISFTFTGKGSLIDRVREAAQNDKRICYPGNLPYEEYIGKLKSADVLINPRNMSLPENRNNFPSKVMDYLATGRPVISTRFPGWERFDEVICFVDSLDEALKGLSTGALDLKENADRREFASSFLWENQVRRIVE